jgi:hypothetical protein
MPTLAKPSSCPAPTPSAPNASFTTGSLFSCRGRYSAKTAGTQPRYKLHALNLATDPIFGIISAAAEACALSEASPCDAVKGVVSDLVDNGPMWLQAMLNVERVANINRFGVGLGACVGV